MCVVSREAPCIQRMYAVHNKRQPYAVFPTEEGIEDGGAVGTTCVGRGMWGMYG